MTPAASSRLTLGYIILILPTRPMQPTGSLPRTQRLLQRLQHMVRKFIRFGVLTALNNSLVARHMNHLSVSAPNPAYLQQAYLDCNSRSQNQPSFAATSPLAEYSNELSYLSASSMPAGDSRYWHNTRDESVRLLSQGGSCVLVFQLT